MNEERTGSRNHLPVLSPISPSEDLHPRIESSKLIIYPESGHGGIFRFHDKFAPVAVEFLGR